MDPARALTIVCTVACAMAAGAFFTFSTFTIRGLQRLPPARGAAAMQEVNREAPTPLFMLLLFGTGAACLVLAILSMLHPDDGAAPWRIAAAALYLAGVVLLTIAYHVPRNNRLDRLDPESAEGAAYWAIYLREWVRMNHVRTIAPLAAAVLLAASLAAK